MGKYLSWIKRLLIAVLIMVSCGYVVLFCVKNSTVVDIDLFFIKLHGVKLELAMVASFILGGLVGVLSSVPMLLAVSKRYRRTIKSQSKSLLVQNKE